METGISRVGTVAELENVTKRYGNVTALDDLSLSVRAGEVFSLLGPNGAGKTTSINLLLGLARPTGGKVQLFGRAPEELAARRRIGAMLQETAFESRLRVAECVRHYSRCYPSPMASREALELAGIAELARRPVNKLSGGQKQRLMFALALCGNPELLFLDEPTAGLDVETRRALWGTVRALAADGRTVILTTHYLEEADALSDRIAVLAQGRLIAEGTPAEIKSRAALRRIRCRTRLPAASLTNLPGLRTLENDGALVEITTLAPETLLRELLARDATLTELEVSGARLEDAFLELTRQPERRKAA